MPPRLQVRILMVQYVILYEILLSEVARALKPIQVLQQQGEAKEDEGEEQGAREKNLNNEGRSNSATCDLSRWPGNAEYARIKCFTDELAFWFITFTWDMFELAATVGRTWKLGNIRWGKKFPATTNKFKGEKNLIIFEVQMNIDQQIKHLRFYGWSLDNILLVWVWRTKWGQDFHFLIDGEAPSDGFS